MSDSNNDSLDLLRGCSTATVTEALFKMGYPLMQMKDVRRVSKASKLVGWAVTLRYLPARADHAVDPKDRNKYAQQVAIESVGKRGVLVVDARGVIEAGIFGDIYATRIMFLGGAGIVTDGAVRDSPFISNFELPVFARAVHGLPHRTKHWASDVNIPISCGEVLVEPGDAILGDDDGVVVIPKQLVSKIAESSFEQETRDEFVRGLVAKGIPAQKYDVDPFTPELQQEYNKWREEKLRSLRK